MAFDITLPLPVDITPVALTQVKALMATKQVPDGYALRLGIKGSGGCAGYGMLIGFDHAKTHDTIYKLDGLDVIIDKRHAMYLLDQVLDYQNTADATGFTFAKKVASI